MTLLTHLIYYQVSIWETFMRVPSCDFDDFDDFFSHGVYGILPNKYKYFTSIPDENIRSIVAAFEHVMQSGFTISINRKISFCFNQ